MKVIKFLLYTVGIFSGISVFAIAVLERGFRWMDETNLLPNV